LTDWDFVYAHIIAATGWHWDQVDTMTIPRYRALTNYWRQFPPAHLLLRALVGFKPEPATDKPSTSSGANLAGLDALMALAPGGTLDLSALTRQ
jgi:hypothetical protein